MDKIFGELIFYAFAAVAFIQLGYYLFFFSRLAFYRKKINPPTEQPNLSVIICARDEELNLGKNLPVVLQQKYHERARPLYEVIVVNDNSEDDTQHYLKSIVSAYKHYRYIELKQPARHIPGKKYPLSIGLKGAQYEYVALTDADCRPASVYWLEEMSKGFHDEKEIVLGYGAYNKKQGLLNKIIRFETFFSALQYLSLALAGLPYMGVGRNLAYKKELFFRHKGFLSHMHIPSGDDDLFINAAATCSNTSVVIDKNAFTFSNPKESWNAWMNQKRRHFSTGKYYKTKHKIALGLFSSSHFLFYILFLASLFYPPFFYYTLGIFILRMLVVSIIFYKSMQKLDEGDLWKYSLIFDLLMPFYYLIFVPALILKPNKKWK